MAFFYSCPALKYQFLTLSFSSLIVIVAKCLPTKKLSPDDILFILFPYFEVSYRT